MTQTEALKLALEALEWSTSCISFDDFDDMPEALEELNKVHQAITAIKEALAQPAVAEPHKCTTAEGEDTRRAWEGLSVFEINDLVTNTEHGLHELVERTEKLLKEKNT